MIVLTVHIQNVPVGGDAIGRRNIEIGQVALVLGSAEQDITNVAGVVRVLLTEQHRQTVMYAPKWHIGSIDSLLKVSLCFKEGDRAEGGFGRYSQEISRVTTCKAKAQEAG